MAKKKTQISCGTRIRPCTSNWDGSDDGKCEFPGMFAEAMKLLEGAQFLIKTLAESKVGGDGDLARGLEFMSEMMERFIFEKMVGADWASMYDCCGGNHGREFDDNWELEKSPDRVYE